jgi:hypothetical protein
VDHLVHVRLLLGVGAGGAAAALAAAHRRNAPGRRTQGMLNLRTFHFSTYFDVLDLEKRYAPTHLSLLYLIPTI